VLTCAVIVVAVRSVPLTCGLAQLSTVEVGPRTPSVWTMAPIPRWPAEVRLLQVGAGLFKSIEDRSSRFNAPSCSQSAPTPCSQGSSALTRLRLACPVGGRRDRFEGTPSYPEADLVRDVAAEPSRSTGIGRFG